MTEHDQREQLKELLALPQKWRDKADSLAIRADLLKEHSGDTSYPLSIYRLAQEIRMQATELNAVLAESDLLGNGRR